MKIIYKILKWSDCDFEDPLDYHEVEDTEEFSKLEEALLRARILRDKNPGRKHAV